MIIHYRNFLLPLCIFFLAITVPVSAWAASFTFSYVYQSGKVLDGSFDGVVDLLDSDRVHTISNLMATYDGSLIATVSRRASGVVSFTGNHLDFAGALSTTSLTGFGFNPSTKNSLYYTGVKFCPAGAPGNTCPDAENEVVNPGTWTLTQTTASTSVPEPTAAMLFGVGALMLGGALRGQSKA